MSLIVQIKAMYVTIAIQALLLMLVVVNVGNKIVILIVC